MKQEEKIRHWLRSNNYEDIADLIDEVLQEWASAGTGTRRNWWDVLAGRPGGAPISMAGREFPVLVAAQLRQGRPVTANAISRNNPEVFPPRQQTNRWPSTRARANSRKKSDQ